MGAAEGRAEVEREQKCLMVTGADQWTRCIRSEFRRINANLQEDICDLQACALQITLQMLDECPWFS
jgi:hypothetical protein